LAATEKGVHRLKSLSYPLQVALLAGVYTLTGYLGLSQASVYRYVTLIWLPTGIALAALLLLGYRLWPGVALGALVTNAVMGAPFGFVLVTAVGNTLEALTAVYILQRYIKLQHSFDREWDILGLFGVATTLSTSLSATIGISTLVLMDVIHLAEAGNAWLVWWVGDSLGALIITPLLLTWSYKPRISLSRQHYAEAMLLVICLTGLSLLIFSNTFSTTGFFPLAFLTFPFLIWTALRFSIRAATTDIFILYCVAIWSASRDSGPLIEDSVQESVLFLWTYMVTAAVTTLLIAAVLAQHKRAQQSLQERTYELMESEARNKALIQAIPDLMIRTDRDGYYVDVMAGSEFKYFLIPREEMIGKHVREVLPPAEAERRLQYIDKAFRSDTMQVYEYELDFPDGRHYFEARVVVSGENETLTIVRNVTEHKVAERQHFQVAVERARVQILSKFIQDASHEFRTPLSTIKTSVYILTHAFDPQQAPRLLARIEEQADAILTLIEGLVMMAQLDAKTEFQRTAVDLNILLSQLEVKRRQAAEEQQLTLTFDIATRLPKVLGDTDWLYIALSKLLDNAFRHTPAGGHITVCAKTGMNAMVIIEIKDTGYGIASEVRSRIFERFYRGDRAPTTRGFGLGLPIARQIIEGHSGSIEMESELGQGSTFRVLLPILST
jgi:PAS domain S-box-containing protein